MEHNNATSTGNLRSSATGSSSSTTPTRVTPSRATEQVSQKPQEQMQQQQSQQQQQQSQQSQQHHSQQQQQQSSLHQSNQHTQQQFSSREHQQQFCLRWHNHQTSLLSTLPVLLDQSHLTDVTISAEGRTLRAHRVVLSACSSFFLEIFRTLDNTHHPVIIIPGASFQAIVSLLTFMYSGEVNVYEEQIPTLLSLAETLGIKGLADVHNNLQKNQKNSMDKDSEEPEKSLTPPTPPPSTASSQTTSGGNFTVPLAPVQPPVLATNISTSPFSSLLNPALSSKLPSSLENFFLKSLQFYPNLMHHQPLNFSQTALNKTTELLAKFQQQCNLYQANLALSSKDLLPLMHSAEDANSSRSVLANDLHATKRFCTGLDKKSSGISSNSNMTSPQHGGSADSPTPQSQSHRDIKRIDKIVENLRGSSSHSTAGNVKHVSSQETVGPKTHSPHLQNQLSPLTIKTSIENYASNPASSPLMTSKSSIFTTPTTAQASSPLHPQLGFNISAEDQLKLQQHLDKYAASCAAAAAAAGNMANMDAIKQQQEQRGGCDKMVTTPQSPQNKVPSSSKLYATCFICHKQLSNQYNLRVHLETHQNVRYACNVCSHVSRSKDALRKHVSYRHPGAPSPCETEARRKRANKLLASSINASAAAAAAVAAAGGGGNSSSGDLTPTSPSGPPFPPSSPTMRSGGGGGGGGGDTPHTPLSAAQLNSAYQMFLPNQFHLAAAVANVAAQQHFRENPSGSSNDNSSNVSTSAMTSPAAKDLVAPESMPSSNLNRNSPFLDELNKTNTVITTEDNTTPTNNTNSPKYTTDVTSSPHTFSSLTESKMSPSITNP